MKRTLFFICAAVLVACTPKIPMPKTTGQADFSYTVSNRTVTFTNTSEEGLKASMWDFGDGSIAGNMETVKHTYAKDGEKKVVMVAQEIGGSYTYNVSKTITIGGSSEPTKTAKEVWLTGFRLYSISKNYGEFYIQYQLEGVTLMDQTFDILTTPQLMLDYILPVDVKLKNPYKIGDIPDPFDWYDSMLFTTYCSQNSLESLAGDIILIKYFDNPSVMDGQKEYIVESGGTKVGILFEYK